MTQYYQGDIGLIKIEKLPEGITLGEFKNGLVIAAGEVTGHYHVLDVTHPTKVKVARDANGFYLQIDEGKAILTHNKHAQQEVGTGLWFIPRQIERDILREFRQVID